jgi:hypothetical protein
MEKTWKPTTAGILAIVAGAGQVISGIIFGVIGGIAGGLKGIPGMAWISGAVAIPMVILGIVAIVGGIYALKRRIWGLALAGSICAAVGPWILGIPAIIFVALGKDEFE